MLPNYLMLYMSMYILTTTAPSSRVLRPTIPMVETARMSLSTTCWMWM